jgi:hypothetical protein
VVSRGTLSGTRSDALSASRWFGAGKPGLVLHKNLKPGRVVVSNPLRTRAIAEAKIKTDKVDAEVLARLLAGGWLPERSGSQMMRRSPYVTRSLTAPVWSNRARA